jgi:hypothetical protein
LTTATATAPKLDEGIAAAVGESYNSALTTATATATATDSAVVGYTNSRRNRKRQSTASASSSRILGRGIA